MRADEPLKVKAHCCPAIADWDADGMWDVLAGSDDGSVTWFRNVGTPGSPRLAEGVTLVDAYDGVGYGVFLQSKEQIVPGIRSQIEVVDYNGDGKLDLLLGDFCTAYHLKKDATPTDVEQVKKLLAEQEEISRPFAEAQAAMRDDFAKRFPSDDYSDEADKEWTKAYQELKNSTVAKDARETASRVDDPAPPDIWLTRGARTADPRSTRRTASCGCFSENDQSASPRKLPSTSLHQDRPGRYRALVVVRWLRLRQRPIEGKSRQWAGNRRRERRCNFARASNATTSKLQPPTRPQMVP